MPHLPAPEPDETPGQDLSRQVLSGPDVPEQVISRWLAGLGLKCMLSGAGLLLAWLLLGTPRQGLTLGIETIGILLLGAGAHLALLHFCTDAEILGGCSPESAFNTDPRTR